MDESSDPNKYRPHFLTAVISKVFKTIILDQLRSSLEREGLLSENQYRFQKRRSAGYSLAFVSHS